ncbi:hypothetical protein GGR90_002435 [Sphingopyxis italica]|uniref:SecDF P1 head subdomain domain-containing protein n=1 Tax=Sphingopyxis italica TaxID=1129133 RepID=A0A7X6B9N2_9SPHN|nr:hypothetical protein [Sphingopyxis italica]NJB90241.1 hypothetical protein [Sphingopyxis italica]
MRLNLAPVLLASALLLCPAALTAQAVAQSGAAAEKGIWIGNLDLCRSGPVKAVASIELYSSLPIVSIVLPAALHDALEELTAANIGKPLPIRVNGRVVSEPNVNEPISGGELQISGVDQAEADRIAAALQSCSTETARTGA